MVFYQSKWVLPALMAMAVSGLSGCASTNITPQYISPNTYASYGCDGLNQEYKRIKTYIDSTEAEKSSFSTSGVSIGLAGTNHHIYPSISVGLGNGGTASARKTKLSRLYGEHDAVVQAGRLQGCSFTDGLSVYGEDIVE